MFLILHDSSLLSLGGFSDVEDISTGFECDAKASALDSLTHLFWRRTQQSTHVTC